MAPKVAPYGTWDSPLTVETITDTANVPDLVDILVDPLTSKVYHIEKRPAEGGRDTLLETETGREITGSHWDLKTKANGYGGAPAIVHGGVVYFSHIRDGRVYKVHAEGSHLPVAITPENPSHKFANFDVYPLDSTFLVGVLEDHTGCTSPSTVVNSLCLINVSTKAVTLLESDASFYSSPKFSPDGKRLAWVEWDLPDMPWNGTEIWVADVVEIDGSPDVSLGLKNPRYVAGEHGKISVAYPTWLSNDSVLFTSDVSGFENPWTYDCTTGEAKPVFETPMAEAFAQRDPPKKFGWSPYAIAAATGTKAVFAAIKDGRSVLYAVDLSTGIAELLPSPYVEIQNMRPLRADLNQVVFIGTTVDSAPGLIQCTLSTTSDAKTEATFTNLQPGTHALIPSEYISLPRPLSLLVPHENRPRSVHAIYYAPNNPEYAGLDGERPPCVVNVHGGPVGLSPQSFSATQQFFTTRGWAWLDVNHGGSSGYGRAYMERLRGTWGIVDVEDCIDTVRILSAPPHDLIDSKRLFIRGASAGGFTTLAALSLRADAGVFAAGCSLYGISDLRRLELETHKFESGYLTMLMGSDPQTLLDRSPLFHAEKITAPLLILQGDADIAVPPSQAEVMVESIQKRGGVVEYKLYSGEGHGWKRKDTIQDALRREIRFYSRVLGIECGVAENA
ncbi:Peptidase-S9 domain-containing protein [Mycena sanguinolenta]|uniref:Peptidase-S9 domain-containing protein n=1 Tax=Mycena sanguinolenta TaxID=230812 RepID=A0A8H6YHW5_9AGAR|nr:Peptidase-S9 domain-containing protein [Mycena sanguinolenta]